MVHFVNKATIMGLLGRDPEVRNFPNGGRVVNLRVATTESWTDQAGGRKERTEWHAVAIHKERAQELALKYLNKGSAVWVEGANETRKWQNQEGKDCYLTEITVRAFRGEIGLVDRLDQHQDDKERHGRNDRNNGRDLDGDFAHGGGQQERRQDSRQDRGHAGSRPAAGGQQGHTDQDRTHERHAY